jgi:hypothetical protein
VVATLIGHPRLVLDSIRVEQLALSPANRRWAADFIAGPSADTSVVRPGAPDVGGDDR